MKYLRQMLLILAVALLGELLHYLIPLSVPASIYGIILLFLALEWKIIPLGAVRETGYFMLEIMPMMFIPSGVELLDKRGILRPILAPFLVITLVSTVAVMGVAGRTAQAVIRRERESGDE